MGLFSLEIIEGAEGPARIVELSFDFEKMPMEQQLEAVERWDQTDPANLAASLLFSQTGLPEEHWPDVGAVLLGIINGDTTHIRMIGETDGE